MIIKLNHPDGTEMDVEGDDIIDAVRHFTKDGFYTTVHFEDYYIVCLEGIEKIEDMLGKTNGQEM